MEQDGGGRGTGKIFIDDKKFGKGGTSDPEAYSKTSVGSGTLFDVPKDIIWGWNWKESMPNAVASQLSAFLALWAIEADYDNDKVSEFKNPRVKYWRELLSSGYELSSENGSNVDYGDGIVDIPRIRPINYGYQCLIDRTPVKYIPALPNISQVLTKDAKGGVGIDRISINAAYADKMYIDLTITISNPYELMEQSSFWRFFTVGQQFMVTLGWQDEGLGYYNPSRGHDESGVLAEKFKDFPTRTVVPPIIDPHTNKLNEFFFNIDTTSPKYLYPAFGFWQSFIMTLQVPSFTMDGSKLSGSLRFITPGQFMSKMIVTGQISAGATDFINKKNKEATSILSKMNSDIGFKEGEWNPDKVQQYQTMYIKLGYALEAIIASHNTLINKSGASDMHYQQTMIFFSKDGSVRVGDDTTAPVLNGNGPTGKCNFWIGMDGDSPVKPEGPQTQEEATKQTQSTPSTFSHVNKIIDHLIHRPEYKAQSVYWHEDDQQNKQQTAQKELKTLYESIKTISDIPIHFLSFRRFLEDNRGMRVQDMLQKFCDQFLLEQTGFSFHLSHGMNQNVYYLNLADQFYKSGIQQERANIGSKIALPALALRQYILDEFRWKHFTLRYGDYQSLVQNATMMQQLDVQRSIMEFLSVDATAKSLANATAAMRTGGDVIYNQLLPQAVRPQITKEYNQTRSDAPQEGASQGLDASSSNIASGGNPSQDGATNLSNKGYYGRNEMLRQLIAMGMQPDANSSVWSTIGSYIKGFMDKIDVSIHGTFGIYEGAMVYFIGAFEFLRGFYNVINVNHELARGEFTTRFELRYMGRDAFNDSPKFVFYDPVENRLIEGQGTSTDDVLGDSVKKMKEQ